ncbi:IclR family transcriptional regulator [Staphylococcus gallinarum]|uniref:Glycerol operon regulatory protein n=3 Tax=Staphylococcus gallinarum TaxID=1293 RepID=A0A418HPH7_STAGA|nr:IclR family transcriptional regulator [Staphylococcus gallinarum]MCD8826418.1 IclR family transcriptional regulator [Staphylococcus gallinarum]MCQ9288198.1 IclR family transcriptional regulator [Staphylococcus gallinarum]PTE79648.1 transcriptional regulator [Staphylococcus gallinarum]RIL43276.1 IclR family transcriptional regulator [Staphylococcus gallinarum]
MGSNVQSVDRALTILEIISNEETVSLKELVEFTGLSKSTIHRIVNSLIVNGYVRQDENTAKYEITFKMFQLGNKRVQNIDFLNVAKSMISQLTNTLEETCHLVVEDNNEVLYIDKFVPSNNSHAMASKIGKRAPMYCTAVGKSILSTYTNEKIKEIWDQTEIKKLTENTITEFDTLMEEINEIREQGYSVDNEENEKGIYCVSTYFVNYRNEVQGAISLSFSIQKLEKKDYYVKELKNCAFKISKLLGYD